MPPAQHIAPGRQPLASHITLRSEWSLMAFSLLAAILFGMLATAVTTDWSPGAAKEWSLAPQYFLGFGLLAMALSAAHLGKKLRAWRAILNVAHSWLSREIMSFSLFLGLGTAYLVVAAGVFPGALVPAEIVARGTRVAEAFPVLGTLGWLALACGLLTLISIDRVYDFAIRPVPMLPHSAGALLSGVFFAGILMANPLLAGGAGALKLCLYVARKVAIARKIPARSGAGQAAGATGPAVRLGVSALRVGIGLLLPAVAWVLAPGSALAPVIVICTALLGELIDRAEFYDELEIMTPARQMAADLRARLAAL